MMVEAQSAFSIGVDLDGVAFSEIAREQSLSQRIDDLLLYCAFQWTCAVDRIITCHGYRLPGTLS